MAVHLNQLHPLPTALSVTSDINEQIPDVGLWKTAFVVCR